jgi:hypothetical protein
LHFQHVLGLGRDLLPVVPDKNAKPAPYSKIKQFGKVPSEYNADGDAHGIAKWPVRQITDEDIDRWSEDRRLSVCVRASAVRAIDVDITNPTLAENVLHVLDRICGISSTRRIRNNSSKFLCPFLLTGEYSKRIIDCGENGRIEFLADGQQWLVAGGHESGARYEWAAGLPESIEQLSAEQFERLWAELKNEFDIKVGDHNAGSTALQPRNVILGGAHPAENTLLTEITDAEEADLTSALEYPPLVAAAADNDFWSEIGYALLSIGEHGAFIFREFSLRAPNYEPGVDSDWWETHRSQTPRSDFRHIFTLARKLGWRGSAEPDDFDLVEPRDTKESIVAEPRKSGIGPAPVSYYPTTDIANARRLHDNFAGKQVVFGRGCFHEWTGTHWARNDTAGKRCALELTGIVRAEAEELRPKLEALIEAASVDLRADYDTLREKRRANRAGSDLYKKISNTDLWRTYATIEDLEIWAKQCESASTQANAAVLFKTVMEVL